MTNRSHIASPPRSGGLRQSAGRLAINYAKTGLLLAGLTGLFGAIGYLLGGVAWLVIALVIAGVMNLAAFWFSDQIVLRMHGAEPIERRDAPWLYDMVARLARRAELPMPALYVIPDSSPNAFATGRSPNHAAVAVTEGLIRIMPDRELEGVIAHELAHVKNRDMLIMTVAASIGGAISMLANILGFSMLFGGNREGGGGGLGGILMIIFAPLLAMIIQMSISRGREYEADRVGARIAGSSQGLANALQRLARAQERIPTQTSPATAHLFIMQPLSGDSLQNLFATHPPIEERVMRLRAMTA